MCNKSATEDLQCLSKPKETEPGLMYYLSTDEKILDGGYIYETVYGACLEREFFNPYTVCFLLWRAWLLLDAVTFTADYMYMTYCLFQSLHNKIIYYIVKAHVGYQILLS